MKKTVGDYKRNWDTQIKYALWENRLSIKCVIRKSPFQLVYRMQCRLHIQSKILVYQTLYPFTSNKEALQERINQLVQLDESRRSLYDKMVFEQERTKHFFFIKTPVIGNLRWEILCYYGIRGVKSPVIIKSSKVCGLDLIRLKKKLATILLLSKGLMVMSCLC